jgi:hypothetical protein
MTYSCTLYFILPFNQDETLSFKKDVTFPFLPMDHRNLFDHGVTYKTQFCVFDLNEQKFQAMIKIDQKQWSEELGPEDMTEMGWVAIDNSDNPFPSYNLKTNRHSQSSQHLEEDDQYKDEPKIKILRGKINNSGKKFGFIDYEGQSYIYFPNHIPSDMDMLDFQEGDPVDFTINKKPGQVHPENGRAGSVLPVS